MLTPRWAKPSSSFSNGNCVEARWRKSSHSAQGHCLEAAFTKSSYSGPAEPCCLEAAFRKSSHSFHEANCAEARTAGGLVQVRDSKDPGPVLSFTPAAWHAFLNHLRS